MATFTVPTTGVYENSRTGGRFKHIAGSEIDLALAVDLGMEGASLPAAGPPFTDAQVTYIDEQVEASEPASSSVAHTATVDGTGTGQIAVGTDLAQVTSGNANHIMTLPNAPVNAVVTLRNGATGYELRSHSPTTVAINGGTGAGAESAVPANTRVICHRDTATTWICHDTTTAGVVSASEVAAP